MWPPGAAVDLSAVSQKDIQVLKFGVNQNGYMVLTTVISNAADVHQVRKILGEKSKIISKIENQKASAGLMRFWRQVIGSP